jgi:methionine-gamma-lyase
LYATSSFRFESLDEGMAIFRGESTGHSYTRYGNPTIDAVAKQLARLESYGGDFDADALVLSSGMAAIATVLLGLLRPGDRILTQENLYGGTANLMEKLLDQLNIKAIMMDSSRCITENGSIY